MVTIKRTYGLPADALAAFEKEVPEAERSAVVAALLRTWLAEKSRENLRRDLEDGASGSAISRAAGNNPGKNELSGRIHQQPRARRAILVDNSL